MKNLSLFLMLTLCAEVLLGPAAFAEVTPATTLITVPPLSTSKQLTLQDMVTLTAPPKPPEDEPVLMSTTRLKRCLKHPLGQKMYGYRLDSDHPLVFVDHKLKVFKDGRPFRQSHPYKYAYKRGSYECQKLAPYVDVAAGVGNLARLFAH